ncbi:MAG: response regulator [Anaerolineales bacterium]|nr:response regulator [Anaerolineales bacterium]
MLGKILIVDDNEYVREPLGLTLEFMGHTIEYAGDGYRALEMVQANSYDLILLDLMMPGMDGSEVLRQLKEDPTSRHIPVVMISALDDLELVARCIKLGAEDYLFKPFNEVLLEARVDACLTQKGWHDQEQKYLEQIQQEQEKAEHLLLNILPAPVTERLKQGETLIADSFAEVTVLFADIVDFTQMAAVLPPGELVSLLNSLFTAFDDLVQKYGLEKIKTVGDAYLVVGGLLDGQVDHACAVADLALAMRTAVSHFVWPSGTPVQVRIGISTGPITAGVIGKNKFAYDIWGDTVNTANRMQEQCTPGCILISQTTYNKLNTKYRFAERNALPIKGKGEMNTYVLENRLFAS